MKSLTRGFQSGEEGRGAAGCVSALALMMIVIFLGFKLVPVYFNYYKFKGDLNAEAGSAAGRSVNDGDIIENLIKIAENNSIPLTKENIKIIRMGSQLVIEVEYKVPVDFIIMTRSLNFKPEGSSFTGG